jgi:hypothetical protein
MTSRRIRLLSLVLRRRATLEHQDTVVIYSSTRDADLAAHRARGAIGPSTLVVEILEFDKMSDEELAARRLSTARLSAASVET